MRPLVQSAALARSRVRLNDPVRRLRELMRLVSVARWLLGFIVLLLFWQITLLLALVGGFIHLASYVGMHVVGCAASAAWPILRLKGPAVDERYSTALQIVVWSAFAGPFGAFSATALTFAAARVAPGIARVGEAEARTAVRSSIERVERAHTALLDHRVRLEGASRIRPLIDVIAEGSRTERLEALRVVYRNYDAKLSPVLKRGLYDPDASVRVLAATVTAKLHGTYTRLIGDRQTEAATNSRVEQNWLTLAEARLDYAQSGLLESPRACAQIEHAIAALSRAVEVNPAGRASAALLDSARRQLAARNR